MGESKPAFVVALCVMLAGGVPLTAAAADIHVMSSGGLTAAFKAVIPAFEAKSGHRVDLVLGPSMGTAAEAIPMRLKRGEPADVVLMVGYALGDLEKNGTIAPGSRVDLARSRIGLAVKAGAPKPDIATLDAFKRTLIAARSIAYSDSASGVYIEREMYQKLGLHDQLAAKSRMIVKEPVGEIVARGEAELGFQQISELMPVAGITIVGPIPDAAQSITVYAGAVPAASREPASARELLTFLQTPDAEAAMRTSGLDPMTKE